VPIYEFFCNRCGHEFEQILSFSETRLPACTSCQSDDVVRRVSKPAIHFKGSGWYITDSKKSDGKKESSKPSGESVKAKDGDSGSASGGEKKAEAGGEGAKSESAKSDSAKAAEPAKAAVD
jgi:putative FmdB family regulatory protein